LTIQPDPATIKTIQDKYDQKVFISSAQPSVPISPFKALEGENLEAALLEIGKTFGYPMMLKSRRLAYDGRGNKVVRSPEDVPASIAFLRSSGDLYVEKWVPFTKELAVMVAKSVTGDVVSYPCVETVQKDNICHLVIAPAQIDGLVRDQARVIAENVVSAFSGCGIFGVELFLLPDGSISFNEVAPRPHNSGHYTIEACHTSQFEQHLRCITGMPLGSADLKVPAAVMVNIIGLGNGEQGLADTLQPCKDSLDIPGATVHLYGKAECKLGRKMGHITIVGDSMGEVLPLAQRLAPASAPVPLFPLVGIIMGSDSDLPTVKPAAVMLKGFDVPFELSIVSAHRTPERMVEYAKTAHKRGLKVIIAAAGGAAHLPGMVAALTPLPVIGIPVALKFLDGVDSLHSIVQMPRGVPVATVAINNAVNAALLAIRMLGTAIPSLQEKLVAYRQSQEKEVLDK
ncbi:phosphoribosylaminoimidazole carboxylase ade2, partial [Kappamyces sp. JEL0680]